MHQIYQISRDFIVRNDIYVKVEINCLPIMFLNVFIAPLNSYITLTTTSKVEM